MSMHSSMSGDRPTRRIYGTRSPVLGRNGVIATSQPLASAAGLKVLQDGGNAIDAAVTAAAVLAVVEPTMTGVGGDLFALVFDGRTRTLKGLNSSGHAGSAADADALLADGCSEMPTHGVRSVSVPGSVAGWLELLTSHGTIPPARALAPAIRYARDGFPVSEIVADQWAAVETRLANDPDAARVLRPTDARQWPARSSGMPILRSRSNRLRRAVLPSCMADLSARQSRRISRHAAAI
jgi:gamma-glutamyltranspeptidase/glutathione hydrolase